MVVPHEKSSFTSLKSLAGGLLALPSGLGGLPCFSCRIQFSLSHTHTDTHSDTEQLDKVKNGFPLGSICLSPHHKKDFLVYIFNDLL